ncbi:MAG: hypothetical protein M1838_002742 [Thelocarpon superellum]|nr:MAG: hypothetical protein M1838_002742 [Thelocarpon superellum]
MSPPPPPAQPPLNPLPTSSLLPRPGTPYVPSAVAVPLISTGPSSFAAKARAAEAAAQRQGAGRELEAGELPNSAPVSLAAYTTFKPSSRSKGLRTQRLRDISDQSPATSLTDAGNNGSASCATEDHQGKDKEVGNEESEKDGKGKEPVVDDDTTSTAGNVPAGAHMGHGERSGDQISGTDRPTTSNTSNAFDKKVQPISNVNLDALLAPAPAPAPAPIISPAQEDALARLGVWPRLASPIPGPMRGPVPWPSQAPIRGPTAAPLQGPAHGTSHGFSRRVDHRKVQKVTHTSLGQADEHRPDLVSHGHQTHQQSVYRPVSQRDQPLSIPLPFLHFDAVQQPGEGAEHHGHAQPVTDLGQSGREKIRESLNTLAATSSARSKHVAIANNAATLGSRSVMFDPATARRELRPFPNGVGTEAFPQVDPALPDWSPLSDEAAQHPLRGSSEALPGWKDRRVEIFREDAPPRTDEELRAATQAFIRQSASTFLPDPFIVNADRAARDRALEAWWSPPNPVEHDPRRAYLHQIAERDLDPARRERRASDPDNTSPPSAAADTANRLLIPLLGTLQGYLAESPRNGYGNFGSFAPVPEWCVDTSSTSSLQTFFGEDWGAPPARVGRDPRYRPLMRQHQSNHRLGGTSSGAGGRGAHGGADNFDDQYEWFAWGKRFPK